MEAQSAKNRSKMQTKVVALFLVVLVVGGEATKPLLQTGVLENLELESRSNLWGLTADINDYMDQTVSMIADAIVRAGLDPMPLPELREGFDYKPLLITYRGMLLLHDGELSNLKSVSHRGNSWVNYFAKMLRLHIQLDFSDMEFVYKYYAHLMDIGPTGTVIGSLNRLTVQVEILVDFNNDEIHLQSLSFTNIGRLSVRVRGNILFDWFVSPIVRVFTSLFNGPIMKYVETTMINELNAFIARGNARIKDIMDSLSY